MRCIFEKGYSVEKHPEAVPCGTVVVLPTGSAETRGKQAALKLPSSPPHGNGYQATVFSRVSTRVVDYCGL